MRDTDYTVTITENGRKVLNNLHNAVLDLDLAVRYAATTEEQEQAKEQARSTRESYTRALEAILLGGFGGSVRVAADGADPMSLVACWDSGFMLGLIWHKNSKTLSLHS